MESVILKEKVPTTQCIALTKQQLEEVEKFKTDLKNGKVEFVFQGTLLETVALLQGAKNIVESFHH